SLQLAHHVAAEAVDRALAGKRHQPHLAALARLEPHRGAGCDIKAHAARLLAIERQRRIGLAEMVVRADLDRPVAGVGNGQRHGLATGIELDVAVLDEEFAGDHDTPQIRPETRPRPTATQAAPATRTSGRARADVSVRAR
ncbi:hypothetical protein QU38_01175, partial [Staphylococcus aureus]